MELARKGDLYLMVSNERIYTIVDYDRDLISVYNLQEQEAPVTYHFSDTIRVGIYEDFEIIFSQLREYME